MLLKKLHTILDFALPRLCLTCGNELLFEEHTICTYCCNNIEIATEERLELEFKRKFEKNQLISDFRAAFVFKENSLVQSLIHSLKYDGNFNVGKFLGNQLYEVINKNINSWNPDLILPIPLHNLKKAERGFNQAAEISKSLSRISKIQSLNNCIKRIRFTKTQTKLNLEERKKNIEGAFIVKNKNKIKGKRILLVDDVVTTGATISECAQVLLQNGASKVFALSVAIAD